jgi:AcrR family transcriptional regulator
VLDCRRDVVTRFTTDEIAAAALGLVDAEGLSALSMRLLAAALGTGPMTVLQLRAR